MLKKLLILLIPVIVYPNISQGQLEKSSNTSVELFSFLDSFYSYDFNNPISSRQDFFFNHNRHNEVNVNLALIALKLNNSKYRMSIGLQGGTYAQDNYAHEPVMYRNIHEAVVGIALNKKKNLWFDMGVFSSHMGFESSISSENLTLTRSFVAENSPYYLSGGKLSYSPGEKWELVIIASNGWQRIQRIEGSSLISIGTQIQFAPKENILFNWSTFLTSEQPDHERKYRYFNNLYNIFEISDFTKVITGFDFGFEQKKYQGKEWNYWYAPVFIIQQKLSEIFFLAYRTEVYSDRSNIIIEMPDPLDSFFVWANSLNFDYIPEKQVTFRIEIRNMNSPEQTFIKNTNFTKNNFFITGSLAIGINKLLAN
jgi:hypothetical protein